MKVTIIDCQKALKLNKRAISKLVKALFLYLNVDCQEIILDFVNEEKICQLHSDFFDDPTPTDCITFPIDDETVKHDRLIGEVFVCTDTAIKYAEDHALDSYEEVCLYITHGILHLIGYDDIESQDKIIMKKKEKQCMDFLRCENLILTGK